MTGLGQRKATSQTKYRRIKKETVHLYELQPEDLLGGTGCLKMEENLWK